MDATTTNKHGFFDSTLLTPLTPHTLKQKKLTATSNNNQITINHISSPILVPTNSTLHSKIEHFNSNKTFDYRFNDNNSPNTNSNNNPKAASTSYLMSKISSLASLTMPKSSHSSNSSSVSSSSSSSYYQNQHTQQTTPPSSSVQPQTSVNTSGGNSLMTNLANKTTRFFNRKNSQPQIESNAYNLSSSSSNSIGSPTKAEADTNYARIISAPTSANNSSSTSPLAFSIEHETSHLNSKYSAVNLRAIKPPPSSTTTNNSNNNTLVNLSRRPFKKRSQSNHVKSDERMWFFNQVKYSFFLLPQVPLEK